MPTTDTIGGTSSTTNGQAGFIDWAGVIASASGSLQSVGINISSAAGHVATAIYSDSSNTPGSLLANSSSAVSTNGWQDLVVTGISIVAGTRYWLAFMTDDNANTFFYDTSALEYYNGGYTYGAWPGTASTANNFVANINMRMTYGAAPSGQLFRTPLLNGLGSGGPFFNNPLGRHRQPSNPQPWAKVNGIYRKAA